MAADFTALPVLLRNNIIVATLIIAACNNKPQTPQTFTVLSSEKAAVQNVNGILHVSGKPFTGKLFTLFPNTNDTAVIAEFKTGKEHGIWRKYLPDKSLKEIREFDNGKKTGTYTAWWNNGNKMLEYHLADDEYEGTCKEWNSAGLLVKVMNYEKGHESGSQQWWYDNGKIKANYVIENGRRYGLLGTKNCINVSDSIFKK